MSSKEHGHSHILPMQDHIAVLVSLVCLTIVTVLIADFDLGILNLPVAMLVATTKASLVFWHFMHLRYDNNINRFVFGAGFGFLLLLYALCVIDIWTR